ncbi:hypothetical protein [Nocardiopsis changdeensis]|uniref:hypothetical protein n=1 Tax=Nocardiopsis changdeensis TaxID=2831969 RepID=UPI003F44E491
MGRTTRTEKGGDPVRHFTIHHDGAAIAVSRGGRGRPLVLCPGLDTTRAERDGWIPLAAHAPERVPEWIARKTDQIRDPRFADFYRTLSSVLDRDDYPRLEELADGLASYITGLAEEKGDAYVDDVDVEPTMAGLMDALAFDTVPQARRLIELLRGRGWSGWTRLARVEGDTGPR